MFRLLALLGGLAAVTDLGTGAPVEESLRRSVVATRLARLAGCDDGEVRTVLYAALLQHLGCTAYAHEIATAVGDDVVATRWSFLADPGRPSEALGQWVPGVAGATGQSRLRVLAAMVRSGRRIDAEAPVATCEVAEHAARRLGLDPAAQRVLAHVTARWDGRGHPDVGGAEVPFGARVMHVAAEATLWTLHADAATAMSELRRHRGRELDPALVDLITMDVLDDLEELDALRAALDAEPDPVVRVDDDRLLEVAATFGDLADLKSPWLHGHSAAVAELAATAGSRLGLEGRQLRLAGHLHDLGRVAVSSRIWAREGRLSKAEADVAALHPYHTERVLDGVPELRDAGRIAAGHHERCDGSGYHRGIGGSQLSREQRVLAAADAYRCLLEAREGRPGATPGEAARTLQQECAAGRLDGDAVSAVLAAAGQQAPTPRLPAGLTERQLEVLLLAAHGLTNREVAGRLGISRRTAEHHLQDAYAKIGCSTRAGAALYAMEHGLLGPAPSDG